MATILDFPKSQVAKQPDPKRYNALAGADIVIFPGIRYEYWDRAATGSDQDEKAKQRKRQ